MIRAKLAGFIAIAAMAITAPAPAYAEWIVVSSTASGTTYAMDPERIKKTGNIVRFWIKGDHSQDASERARSSMSMIAINCSAMTAKTTSRITYDAQGGIITSREYPDYGGGVGYSAIVPDSVMETFSMVVCTEGVGE